MSPRLGIMSLGWAVTRHNKGVNRALFLANWNLENSIIVLKTVRHLMSSGYVYPYPCTPFMDVCVIVHIGVGFGVACSSTKAIPGPQLAEQQQCSPAFFVSMHKELKA